MREIKFRGQRKDDSEWLYGFYGYKEETEKSFLMVETINANCTSYFTDYEIIPETVGQYTGLKDKNGKEIYEGDIIQPRNKAPEFYLIEFKDGGFKRKYKFIRKYQGDEWIETRYFENIFADSHVVVGNIYENSDLLKL